MGPYEIIMTVLCFVLTVFFLRNSVSLYRKAEAETDEQLSKAARKKALLWLAPSLMFFLAVLYILTHSAWIGWALMAIGTMGFGYAIGSGIGANMREH